MRIAGNATLHAPVEAVYAALQDPAVLVRTIPGCERLEQVGEDAYQMTVTAGVASVRGTYAGDVRLTDQHAPHSFVMQASGSGTPGTVSADVTVDLSPADNGTTQLTYDADATVGGMIGGVGQRLLSTVAKRTAGEFFTAVDQVLTGEAERGEEAAWRRPRPSAGAGGRPPDPHRRGGRRPRQAAGRPGRACTPPPGGGEPRGSRVASSPPGWPSAPPRPSSAPWSVATWPAGPSDAELPCDPSPPRDDRPPPDPGRGRHRRHLHRRGRLRRGHRRAGRHQDPLDPGRPGRGVPGRDGQGPGRPWRRRRGRHRRLPWHHRGHQPAPGGQGRPPRLRHHRGLRGPAGDRPPERPRRLRQQLLLGQAAPDRPRRPGQDRRRPPRPHRRRAAPL